MRLLLVEDEDAIARPLALLLEGEGWQVDRCAGVGAALARLEELCFDAAVIDLGLPDGDGLTVCRAARRAGEPAIVVLTARAEESSAVASLDAGADDYIIKPFRARELISRLRAILRRRGGAVHRLGALELDTRAAQVRCGGELLLLTAQEYRLLLFFAAHPGQLLTRDQLLAALWDQGGSFVNDNTLTVTVKRLREKLSAPGMPQIVTVRGMGYRLEVDRDA